MAITRIKLENFTAFENLDMEVSRGVNILIGANGTGKTHLMKVAYCACDVTARKKHFDEKLTNVFMPSRGQSGNLVRHHAGIVKGDNNPDCKIRIDIGRTSFTVTLVRDYSTMVHDAVEYWKGETILSVFIPAKEILSNAPGFRSLYTQRHIHFEETYLDILDRAYLPLMRDNILDDRRKALANMLSTIIGGEVVVKGEEFFLESGQFSLEFTLLAEGLRKLGLLWLLIKNGSLPDGSVLFWDEPETNLNPGLYKPLIEVILELQRLGVQVFLATHDYVILNELDLQMKEEDNIAFHSLYKDIETGSTRCETVYSYNDIQHNKIADTFVDLYDREVMRTFGDK